MSNEMRSKFRDRKRSYQKMRQQEKDNIEGSPLVIATKVLVSIPLVVVGYAKRGIDYVLGNEKKTENEYTVDLETGKKTYSRINYKKQNIVNKGLVHRIKNYPFKKTIVSEKNNEKCIKTDYIKKNNTFSKPDLSLEKKADIENKILMTINKKMIKTKNELEILYSEYYTLKELYQDNEQSQLCKKQLELIGKLIEKINKIKNQYKILKDNYDFDYVLEIDDINLIDNIIDFKQIVDSYGEKVLLTSKYKEIKTFLNINEEISKIDNDIELLKKEKNRRLEEQNIRDEEFKKFQIQLIKEYDKEFDINKQLEEQKLYLENLSNFINKIDSKEQITYKFNGFSELISSSLKYIGLLVLHPLSGILPSIAINTLITQKTIQNLKKSLEVEKVSKIVYEAIDYENELNSHFYNLMDVQNLLSSTLTDVRELKTRYNEKFEKFKYKFPEYEKNYKMLEKFEKQIYDNQSRLIIMQNNIEENKKINSEKIIKVKKLNNN